jgi:protein O-GlcNAc transferase
MNLSTQQYELQLALKLQQTGNYAQAEAICRRLTLASPKDGAVFSLLGTVLAQTGQFEEAITQLKRANELSPQNNIFLLNLGSAYAANKQFNLAIECFKAAIAIKNSIPEGHYNLGNALRDSGRYEEAEVAYRKAINLRANYPTAWNNLGAVYIERYKLDEAKQAIERSISLNPNSPAAHNNLANVFAYQGKPEAAVAQCVKALSLKPDHIDAYTTMAGVFISQRAYTQAVQCYQQIIEIEPKKTSHYMRLASIQLTCELHEEASASIEKMLLVEPEHTKGWFLLGLIEVGRGYQTSAENAFQKAMSNSPLLSIRIRYLLSFSPIVESTEAIQQIRQKINDGIDALLQKNTEIVENPFDEQLGTNFYLAYHGLNDRPLQEKIAALYRKVAPSLTFTAPHCLTIATKKLKKRIGFYSKYIFKHSVAVSYSKIIVTMSQDAELEIFLISDSNHNNAEVKTMYEGFTGAFVCVASDLTRTRQFISSLELDILVYMDIGMDPMSYLMAFSRLAPIQCVMGGHPVTTGIDTLDYYLGSTDAEPENGEQHYSEKLLKIKSGSFSYQRPELPTEAKTLAELGLPCAGKIYACPMMIQKLHPDFDDALKQILELDQTGNIVLFESPHHRRWDDLLRVRLEKKMGETLMQRVCFHPWVKDPNDFMLINAAADVVLDPFHFGIGSTAISIFSVGTPIVTLPGEFMRGRIGYLYCKMLDTMECVATDPLDYAHRAVNIANDSIFRAKIKEKILANNHTIFDNKIGGVELVSAFKSLT